MVDKTYRCLFEATLKASHFHPIGLRSRKLHVWSELTGFGLEDHEKAKWRQFTPVELFAMATLKTLKDKTDLAISRHGSLIRFLSQEILIADVLRIWRRVQTPILTSDLGENHSVSSGPYAPQGEPSPFLCSLSLADPVSLMLAAMESDGSEEQKFLAATIKSDRYQIEFTIGEDEEEVHEHGHLT